MSSSLPVDSRIYDALWALANNTKQDIFEFVTEQFSKYTRCEFFIVSEVTEQVVANVVSARFFDELQHNFQYALEGTPCHDVVSQQGTCFYPSNVANLFPEDKMLADAGIESYLGSPLYDKSNNLIGIFIVMSQQPITDKAFILQLFEVFKNRVELELVNRLNAKRAQLSASRYHKLYQKSLDAILILDQQQAIIGCNPAAEQLFNINQTQLCQPNQAAEEDSAKAQGHQYIASELTKAQASDKSSSGQPTQLSLKLPERRLIIEYNKYILTEDDNRFTVFSIRDITERVQLEQKNLKLATIDPLTGVLNRRAFNERFNQLLAQLPQSSQLAFLLIDIDDFKKVNDTLGHAIGDQLLLSVTKTILSFMPKDYLVGRLGGDEFGIVYTNSKARFDPYQLAKAIRQKIATPHQIATYYLDVSCSIGYSVSESNDDKVSSLYIQADLAMYKAKDEDIEHVQAFNDELKAEYTDKLYIEKVLKSKDLFSKLLLFYQPIVDATTQQIISFEVLLRWRSKGGKITSPVNFIRIAELTERFHDIGQWILKTALADYSTHLAAKFPNSKISINISPKQLSRVGFISSVSETLAQYPKLANRLVFEITEEVAIDSFQQARSVLNELHSLGVSLAVDDFGVGHSSLGLLYQLQFDYLKVDKSLLDELLKSQARQDVYQTIVELAQKLNLTLVQEGVETESQLAYLKQQGCQYIQGFYFYKPMPIEAILELPKNG